MAVSEKKQETAMAVSRWPCCWGLGHLAESSMARQHQPIGQSSPPLLRHAMLTLGVTLGVVTVTYALGLYLYTNDNTIPSHAPKGNFTAHCWRGHSVNTQGCSNEHNWVGGMRNVTVAKPAPRLQPRSTAPAAIDYDHSEWDQVDLPHDFKITQEYGDNLGRGRLLLVLFKSLKTLLVDTRGLLRSLAAMSTRHFLFLFFLPPGFEITRGLPSNLASNTMLTYARTHRTLDAW